MESKRLLGVGIRLCVIALVAACAQKYVAPTSGLTAKLRFTTNTEAPTTLRRFDVAACPTTPPSSIVASAGRSSMLDTGEVSPIQMIGTSGGREFLIREQLIEANKPFVFSASFTTTGYMATYLCKVSGSFLPQALKEYEIRYTYDDQKHSCSVRVYQLSLAADGKSERKLERSQRYARASKELDYCQTALAAPSTAVIGEEILSAFEASSLEPVAPLPTNTPESNRPPAGASAAAATAATAAVAATGGSAWIRVGDRWKYRLNHEGRGVGTVNVEIRDVNGNRVTEQITLDSFKGFRTERDVETKFELTRFQRAVVFPGGYQLAEIAPYFPPGTELKEGQVWRELPGDFAIQHIGKRALLSNAKVVGKEQVNVPAGRFEAWRIESVSEATSYNDQPVSVVCTFWYTPTMSRAVRVSLATKSSYAVVASTEIYELAAFERAP